MSVSSTEKPHTSPEVFNVPNQITAARVVLSLLMFLFLEFSFYFTSLVLFLVAAGTDWVDGYWARRFNQITQLGRILDPFADKLIICGTFVYLAAAPGSLIAPWMAVVIIARELLVTALRSFLEQQGADFSAKLSGKLKMLLQCTAAALCIYRLTYYDVEARVWLEPPRALDVLLIASAWGAVLLTIYSGVVYVAAAIRLLRA